MFVITVVALAPFTRVSHSPPNHFFHALEEEPAFDEDSPSEEVLVPTAVSILEDALTYGEVPVAGQSPGPKSSSAVHDWFLK